MSDKIDEMLASMAPAELAALEVEIDKRAGDLMVGHYYERGRSLAREAVAHYEKTGEAGPLLHLLKSADEPAVEASDEAANIDAELDNCSPEELKAIEDGLDGDIDEKAAVDAAAFYYKQGQEYARSTFEEMKKEAAGRGPAGFGSALLKGFQSSAKKNPLMTMAGTALAIPVAERVFDRR
jgi:hypothetical protein